MKPSVRFAAIFVAALAASASASAVAAPGKAPGAQSARVLQIGDVGTAEAVGNLPGRRMSLLQATQVIIPAEWAAYAQQGVDTQQVVDLLVARGTPWTVGLDTLLAKQGLFSVVDWDARSVYLRNSPADAQSVRRIMTGSVGAGTPRVASAQVPAQWPAFPGAHPGQHVDQQGTAHPGYQGAMAQAYPGGVAQQYPGVNPQVQTYPFQAHAGGPSIKFAVQRTDRTLREVVQRWSKQAGWAFEANYWGAPKDLPVAGSSEFSGNFEEAVIALLNSTRLTDMPVKPCFYTNQVVRVQVATSRCDWSNQDGADKQ